MKQEQTSWLYFWKLYCTGVYLAFSDCLSGTVQNVLVVLLCRLVSKEGDLRFNTQQNYSGPKVSKRMQSKLTV